MILHLGTCHVFFSVTPSQTCVLPSYKSDNIPCCDPRNPAFHRVKDVLFKQNQHTLEIQATYRARHSTNLWYPQTLPVWAQGFPPAPKQNLEILLWGNAGCSVLLPAPWQDAATKLNSSDFFFHVLIHLKTLKPAMRK